MKIILEKISDGIDLSSLSQEERDRYVLEQANRGIALQQAGATHSDVVTFMLANYIKLNWRGAWSSESTYTYNDAVSYLGSSYVALRATTEQPGESAADWKLIAKKGEDGRGIVSFDLFDVQEKTKTYRLLYTDATYQDIAIIDGNDGVDGLTPYIGMNGNWWIGDVDQNIKAEGVDGISPTIGLNGNWYLGAVDTGVKAQATGAYEIYLAGGGTLSEVDFNSAITNIPSHIDDDSIHHTIDDLDVLYEPKNSNIQEHIADTDIHVTTTDKSNWDEKADLDEVLKLDQTTPQTITQSPKITSLTATKIPYANADKQLVNSGIVWDAVKLQIQLDGISSIGSGYGIVSNKSAYFGGVIVFSAATGSGNIGGSSFNIGRDAVYPITNINTGANSAMSFGTKNIEAVRIDPNQNVGIKTTAPKSALQVVGGIQCGDDTAAARADKVGTIRQRDVNNNTLLEFCKNVAGVYEWEKINDKLSLDQTTPQTIQGNVNINGNLNAVTTNVNQSTLPSVNASQDAAILQDGSAFTGTDYVMPTNNVAVKFVASAAHTMGDFTVRVKSSATLTSTTATLTGYLYSDNAGSPSILLAIGKAIRHGSITTSYQELSLGTQYNLVAGTTYWLVIRWSSAPTGGNIIFDSNTDTNGGATSANATSWTLTNVRLRYRLRGRTFYGINAFSTNNYGVYGISTNYIGVYGTSTNNSGVVGSSTNSYGVYGESTNNYGVYGISTNYIGVYGTSTNNSGVYGISTNNRAGYFRRNTASPSAVPVVEIIQDHASDTNSVLDVKQDGTGEIARFFDAGVEVASIEKGGLGIYKKGVVIGDNTDVASAANKGATRYRTTANASYCEICMQTGATTYAWVVIVTNTW